MAVKRKTTRKKSAKKKRRKEPGAEPKFAYSAARQQKNSRGPADSSGAPCNRAPSENAAESAADCPTQRRRQREQEVTREADFHKGGLYNTLGLLNDFCFVFVGAVGGDIRRLP